jgi:APA family basic amino acid/polyamine antiporter
MDSMIKPKLTVFDTTMIVVSLVIGIGIFRTPAMVASATGTPVLFFTVWTLGGIISLIGALTFAEIGSRFPKPGSYYKVVAECYHSSLAFMLNWTGVLIVNGAGAGAVAIIGAEHLNPIILPARLQTQSAVQLTAAAIIVFLLIINYIGIKTGAWAQNILTLLKIAMILLLIVAAFRYRGAPAAATSAAAPAGTWVAALALGLISVFYTYGGYQCTVNFGADVRQAQRNLPKAIFAGIIIIVSCYLLINAAYVIVLGVPGIAGAKLVAAEVARVCFGRFGYLFVSLAICLSAMGFLNVTLMQIPRSYYAMAEDRALPSLFKRVNERSQVQEFTLIFFGATILLSIFFLGTFENLVNYVMFIDALNLSIVASTIFFLRKRAGAANYRGFRVPLYPVLPAVFVIFLFAISMNVLATQTRSALFGMAIMVTGLPIFLLMRKLHKSGSRP